MTIVDKLADKLAGAFFSLIGFRDPVVDDDRKILPYVAAALSGTRYAGLPIGERLPGRHWEHGVRFLGSDYVIKYVSPIEKEVMARWVEELCRQREIVGQYLTENLVVVDYVPVPVDDRLATYVAVMPKVPGKSLLELSGASLFENHLLAERLIKLLENNRRLRDDHGIFVDLVGGTALNLLNPRYTGNIIVREDSQPVVVDTVLIPNHYDPAVTPKQYRWASVYHWCYRRLVLPRERRFYRQLHPF